MSLSIENENWINASLHRFLEQKRLLIAKNKELIDLSMINPDLLPQRLLIDRLVEATVKPGQQRYAVARGIQSLRDAFAYKYKSAFGVELDSADQVCVTFGSKDALNSALSCLYQVGDTALLAKPSYPAHVAALTMAGFRINYFELGQNEDETLFNILEAIKIFQPKVVLLNFPHNPTGRIVSSNFWKQIVEKVKYINTNIINDFVYGEMGYSKTLSSALEFAADDDLVLEVYSLSKAYSIPGWRVGALLGNSKLVEAVSQKKAYLDYGIYLPLQTAASFALTSPEISVTSTVNTYYQRARTLVKGLERIGWQVEQAQAGCSIWAKPKGTLSSAHTTAENLLAKGVAVLPGSVYGTEFADYCRFALVQNEQVLLDVLGIIGHESVTIDHTLQYAL